jgi:hypothetical protein
VYTEARAVLRAVMTDFFFNCWLLEIPSDNRIRHVPGFVYNRDQIFYWKRSRIYMLEVETVTYSCIPQVKICLGIALDMRMLLVVDSFDFRPSSQCILVSVIPSCLCFVNMCLRQVSLLSGATRDT